MDHQSAGALTRRRLLQAGATAALVAAGKTSLPAGAFAQGAGPETTRAILGYIALTDAAPLIVAKVKGIFDKYGMPDVEIAKQASWGTTRDNLVLGSEGNGIDGAHILTPMPYLISTGKVTQNNQPTPMSILARLNLDAQAISVAPEFRELGADVDASPLRETFAKMLADGDPAKVAMTFPGGTHDLWLRYWLAAAGINPDTDVSTIVVPPAQMVANMRVGTMACFCVGEPWNAQLVNQGIGYTATNTAEIWNRHPEKSLGMRTAWIEKHPKAAKALLMAVLEAQIWCDAMANKDELAEIVGRRAWFNVPKGDIDGRLKGEYDYGNGRIVEDSPHFMKFWRDHASYPFKSHDLWFLTENVRWGGFSAGEDLQGLVAQVNREDLWREAAAELGVAESDVPTSTSRGPETFFDGKVFDPEDPQAYLASLSIHRIA